MYELSDFGKLKNNKQGHQYESSDDGLYRCVAYLFTDARSHNRKFYQLICFGFVYVLDVFCMKQQHVFVICLLLDEYVGVATSVICCYSQVLISQQLAYFRLYLYGILSSLYLEFDTTRELLRQSEIIEKQYSANAHPYQTCSNPNQ